MPPSPPPSGHLPFSHPCGLVPCLLLLVGLMFILESPRWLLSYLTTIISYHATTFETRLPNNTWHLTLETSRWWSEDTIVVVTGANRGIGYEITCQLASHGLTVILTSRDTTLGEEATKALQEKGLKVVFHQLDVVDLESIDSFCAWVRETYGGIDILINNAGISYNTGSDNSVEFAENVINTNYIGTKNMVKAAIPLMRPSTEGARIVLVSSRIGRLNGRRNRNADVALRQQLEQAIFLQWVPLLAVSGVLIFIVSFSIGMGAVPWLIMSEIFPLHIKGAAGSLSVLVTQEAFTTMKTENEANKLKDGSVSADNEHDLSISLDKSLSGSLDSLDNLFCRRCLVFDCRLHGYSQTVISPLSIMCF